MLKDDIIYFTTQLTLMATRQFPVAMGGIGS